VTPLSSRVLTLAMRIQQIPAPTFHEQARGKFVRDLFIAERLKDVSVDGLGNVYARLAAKNHKAAPLVVSAHLDTVYPPDFNLKSSREADRVIAPGIGDNSLGVAALFGILWSLRECKIELERDLWFVANVGEEGLGDLKGMREVVERFGSAVIGYLILEGLALGQIYHRAVGVRRYRIGVRTAGGHSWSDYGRPSAVHELALLINWILAIRLPHAPRTTMNVGTMHGGTGVNVLAAQADCEVDLRSEDPEVLRQIAGQVEEHAARAVRKGVRVEVEVIGERPAGEIPPHHPFIALAQKCAREAGLEAVLTAGSTDANIPISRGIPAVVMGVTSGGNAHSADEYIQIEPIAKGLDQLVRFVSSVEGAGG